MAAFGGKADMRKRRLRSEQTVFGENNFPDYNRGAFFRQSFISTCAGAFFFGATGAAVSSDGSLFGGTDEVVSSDGSSFDGTGAAVGFNGSVFGATGTDVSSVGRGRGNGVSKR
jgi:hypothetical protein